jgi:ABC-type multidrug transport system fused ATPase/permease subunit
LRRPSLLILDDSFSALDYRTDLEVRRNIASLDWPHATVIVSQRPSSVMNCDRILVLDNGRVAGLGSHQELLASCELYREIYFSQYEKEEA